MLFIFAASITGVGGGVLRDIITNRKPQILKMIFIVLQEL